MSDIPGPAGAPQSNAVPDDYETYAAASSWVTFRRLTRRITVGTVSGVLYVKKRDGVTIVELSEDVVNKRGGVLELAASAIRSAACTDFFVEY